MECEASSFFIVVFSEDIMYAGIEDSSMDGDYTEEDMEGFTDENMDEPQQYGSDDMEAAG